MLTMGPPRRYVAYLLGLVLVVLTAAKLGILG